MTKYKSTQKAQAAVNRLLTERPKNQQGVYLNPKKTSDWAAAVSHAAKMYSALEQAAELAGIDGYQIPHRVATLMRGMYQSCPKNFFPTFIAAVVNETL